MPAQRASARTVVVGAGTVGAFVAYGLARRGEEVLLLERKEPGLEAAGLNAGTLAVQNKLLPLIPLAMRGVELWQDFERQTRRDLHTVRCGGFRVAHTTAGGERLELEAEQQRRLGLEVEHLSGEEARARAPYLAGTVRAANWCPLDGHNNALTAVKQVVQEAEALGARVQSRSEVLSIEREAGRWRLVTPGGSVGADRLVLAAGLWSRTLAERIGLRLQLEVHNNQMIVTERLPRLIDHVITHVTGRLTLKQKGEGTVLIGGGWPGHHDLENNLKWPALPSLIGNARLATATVPSLEEGARASHLGRTRRSYPQPTSADRTGSWAPGALLSDLVPGRLHARSCRRRGDRRVDRYRRTSRVACAFRRGDEEAGGVRMSDDRRVNRHPVLGPLPEVETVTFRFEGEVLAGRVAEPVAAALLAHGIRTLRYSEPSGRPRGLYCAIGHCMECRMIIDGLANVRACLTPLRQGMQVRRQSLDALASDR